MPQSAAISFGLCLIVSAFAPVATFATGMSEKMDSRSNSQAHQSSSPSSQFQRIEQPLALKIAVTAGGVALTGALLWWFLGNKRSFSEESQKSD
jgi:plastocyanin domain-containing protein